MTAISKHIRIFAILLLISIQQLGYSQENKSGSTSPYLLKNNMSIITGFGMTNGLNAGIRYNILNPLNIELTFGKLLNPLGGNMYGLSSGLNYYFITNGKSSLVASLLSSYLREDFTWSNDHRYLHSLSPLVGFEESLTNTLSFSMRFGYSFWFSEATEPEREVNFMLGFNFTIQ